MFKSLLLLSAIIFVVYVTYEDLSKRKPVVSVSEVVEKVKILKVFPQESGVLVSIEFKDGKRSSIRIRNEGEEIPQEGEFWQVKKKYHSLPTYQEFIFIKKSDI